MSAKHLSVLSSFIASSPQDWSPSTFTGNKLKSLQAILNAILPPSNTLGASDIKLYRFVDYAFTHLLPAEQKDKEIKAFTYYCEQHLSIFSDDKAQIRTIKKLDTDAFDKSSDKAFYRHIKEYALLGYFSDERVLKEQLNFHYVPGEYQGCVKADPNTKLFVSINI